MQKANALTKPISQTIGNEIHIVDVAHGVENQLQGKVVGIKIRGSISADAAKYGPPKIEFKIIKVSASVNVDYQLK